MTIAALAVAGIALVAVVALAVQVQALGRRLDHLVVDEASVRHGDAWFGATW